jgi:hypothetical protein
MTIKNSKVMAGMAKQQQERTILQLDALAAVMLVKFGQTTVTIMPQDMADLNGKYTMKREPGPVAGSFTLTIQPLPQADAQLPGASKVFIPVGAAHEDNEAAMKLRHRTIKLIGEQ